MAIARLRTLITRRGLVIPVSRLVFRYYDERDDWYSVDAPVPEEFYGSGCPKDFQWFLDGTLETAIASPEDLCQWLATCSYTRDADLFQSPDFWQHPRTFEQLRRGDCEDHALFAWRILRGLGYSTEFVVGFDRPDDGQVGRHAWVLFTIDGRRVLLEPVCKDPTVAIRPLEEVRAGYVPHASVDEGLRRRLYGGYVRWYLDWEHRKKAKLAGLAPGPMKSRDTLLHQC